MSRSRQNFPGLRSYLEAAAAEFGHPEAAGPARRVATSAAMAILCARAAAADPPLAACILAKAAELRDRLRVAQRAADLMLADLLAATTPAAEPSDPS